MSNAVDKAIIEWANDHLEAKGLPRDAIALQFGYFISCYSDVTHDYGVTASVEREDGSSVDTGTVWSSVLEDLPAYVAAQEDMYDEHSRTHRASNGYDSYRVGF